jgi:hypothetical protein
MLERRVACQASSSQKIEATSYVDDQGSKLPLPAAMQLVPPECQQFARREMLLSTKYHGLLLSTALLRILHTVEAQPPLLQHEGKDIQGSYYQ